MTFAIDPDVMEQAERRCQTVRRGGLEPYGSLVRAGAQDFIVTMFPRFSRRRGGDRLTDDIDAFYQTFGAHCAQFIHLATEFVRFMQPRLKHHVVERVLLEYEWALFDVEIDEAMVGTPWLASSPPGFLELNPTIRWLTVPFDLSADESHAEQMLLHQGPPFAYAIFRTFGHAVVTQRLTERDVARLARFEGGAQPIPSCGLDDWATMALQRELLIAQPNL